MLMLPRLHQPRPRTRLQHLPTMDRDRPAFARYSTQKTSHLQDTKERSHRRDCEKSIRPTTIRAKMDSSLLVTIRLASIDISRWKDKLPTHWKNNRDRKSTRLNSSHS